MFSTSSQFKCSEASIPTSHHTAPPLNELPRPTLSPWSTGSVSTTSSEGRLKEKSQHHLPTGLPLPSYWCQWARGTERPASEQRKQRAARLHFTAVSVALQLSSFFFVCVLAQSWASQNKLNSWFNCSAQTGTNFSAGIDIFNRTMLQVTINQVITNI